jgi:ion channel-forming bestrophin family protein
VRQLKQFLPAGEESDSIVKAFALRQIIWCYSLADSLRKKPFRENVSHYLAANNIESSNIPNYLLNIHAKDIAIIATRYALNANMQVQLDATLVKLNDAMGKCERIKNTVFPKSYSLLIHFLIYVFLTIFPFGLDDAFVFTEILLTILIPILFVAIEQTAIILQDPFENRPTDTPMTTLSQTIEKNLCELSGMEYAAEEGEHSSYYIM